MKMTKCKDCKYFTPDNRDAITGEPCGHCNFVTMLVAESFFCGFGKTREEKESNKTKLQKEDK